MSASAPDLTDLYRQIVLDHSRHPRNQRRPERYDREAEGHNTLCGDKVRVYLQLKDDTLQDVAFEASGCAICLASASMMTEAVHAHSLAATRSSIDQFSRALATNGGETLTGDLAALSGVSAYPSRIRCATLPWETLRAALDSSRATVNTEKKSPSR
jgi:nitrogen fixation NifU-like protein